MPYRKGQIEAEETKAGDRHAVAGFDLTFSVPKSVSVLWAVTDANTQALIVDAHHAAVAERRPACSWGGTVP